MEYLANDSPSLRLRRRLAIVTGRYWLAAAVLLYAFLHLTAWLPHFETVLRWLPGLPLMRPGLALCLALLALSLLLLNQGRHRLAEKCSAAFAAFLSLWFVGYQLGLTGWALDRLLPRIGQPPLAPNLTPAAACAILALGLALLLLGDRHFGLAVAGALSGTVLYFSLVSIADCLVTGGRNALRDGFLSQGSFSLSLGMVAVSLAVLGQVKRRCPWWQGTRSWAPALVGAVGFLITMTYWCETLGQRQLQSENGARIIAAEISSRLEADGDQMLRSLERLADRCQHISGREEWQGNVLGLLRDYKGLAALALIDQSGSVLQQSPAPSSLSDRSALPAQLLSKAAVEAIRSRRRITASLPGSGPNGRSVVIAILGAGTSDPCALSVVVELSPVAEQILRGNEASLYHVSIRVAGHQIRERGQLADADPQVRVTARANTLGLTWDIEVMPETALLDTADEGFALSNVVLLAGFLVTGLLVASANLWLVARDRNVLVERINGELRAENFRRAETERALVIAKNEADDANRSKSQFLAAMSHEIRTPMNAILGMAELLAESGLNQRQLEYTQVFQSAGSSLMRLLNDILDFSKMEAGKFHLSPVDFHLPGLIASTIKLMDSQVREKGLEFACEIDPALPPMVHGDPERLQQILVNLLSNATKFTPRGSVALRIRLSGEQSPSSAGLSFEVADTGIGIEPVKMGLIFESFEQGDNSISRRFGGSGLGLAISRSLAHQMGGRLTVESEVGKGSVFRFFVTLPVTKPIALKARELAQIDDRDNVVVRIGEPPSSPTPHSNGCRLRILIADDVVDNQFVLAEFLSDTPHFIDFASNGLEALERVREQAYDLVFMDVHMPVLDGLEATRAIREYERSVGRVPSTIVALTADALAEHRQACLEAGCSSHLLKPASRKLLLRCVARCAESRNALSPSKETSEIQTS